MSIRVLGAQLASVLQRASLAPRESRCVWPRRPRSRWMPPPTPRGIFRRSRPPTAGATVDDLPRPRDARWLQRLRRLEVVSVRGPARSLRDHVDRQLARAPALERAARRHSERHGGRLRAAFAQRSRSSADALEPRGCSPRRAALRSADARILAFLPRRVSTVIYAKSPDPFYVQSPNVEFSRMFHL